MATWRAKCWLGSASGYQELEVQSNTLNGAKEQFKRVYGAEQICNLSEVRSGGGLSSSSGDASGWLTIFGFIFAIWVIMQFWWIVVPVAIICLIGWIYSKFSGN